MYLIVLKWNKWPSIDLALECFLSFSLVFYDLIDPKTKIPLHLIDRFNIPKTFIETISLIFESNEQAIAAMRFSSIRLKQWSETLVHFTPSMFLVAKPLTVRQSKVKLHFFRRFQRIRYACNMFFCDAIVSSAGTSFFRFFLWLQSKLEMKISRFFSLEKNGQNDGFSCILQQAWLRIG